LRAFRFFPGSFPEQRPIAVKMRLGGYEPSEIPVLEEFPHRQEVAIPAAVMKRRQNEARLLRQVDELAGMVT